MKLHWELEWLQPVAQLGGGQAGSPPPLSMFHY